MQLYLFVFTMKLLEISIYSMRMVLITSGEKKISSVIGFFEVIVWGFGTATVVNYIFDDLFILIPYLTAGMIGIYIGMGLQTLISKRDTIVISYVKKANLTQIMMNLKEENYGLTVLESEENSKVLLIATKRNRIPKLKK